MRGSLVDSNLHKAGKFPLRCQANPRQNHTLRWRAESVADEAAAADGGKEGGGASTTENSDEEDEEI